MTLTYLPLLKLQREIYGLPRGRERFKRYRALLPDGTPGGGGVGLAPLLIINPMAREPVATRLDAWLALDADGLAARAVADLAAEVADAPGGHFRVATVLADDTGGGWTHRYAWEFARRFERPTAATTGWLSSVLWSEERPTAAGAVAAVRQAVWREVYVQRWGVARTLRDRLAQEGAVLARAGGEKPVLDPEEIAYTREALRPHLDATDLPMTIRLLFGDPAARSLGYEPAGLSPWAGLALARHDAETASRTKPF